jgi:hypothetical protein
VPNILISVPAKKVKQPLSVTHPELAKEADGWDPSTLTSGSGQKMPWVCPKAHKYDASLSHRTNMGSGCPYCSRKRTLPGFNDLKTLFPEIAAEAYNWNPEEFGTASKTKMIWLCPSGHIYQATISHRTIMKSGCPYCSGRIPIIGINDLKTVNPELAQQAVGWDTSSVLPRSNMKFLWECELGHQWRETVSNRAAGRDCPFCSSHRVLPGFNDLATTHPEISESAHDWDPTTLTAFSSSKKKWKCVLGHIWTSTIKNITNGRWCPYCSGHQVLIGFNDLLTTNSEIAASAEGWDPRTVTAFSNSKRKWKCESGHIWTTTVSTRSGGSGCPSCARFGFDPNQDGFLYFLSHPNWQMNQVGITNFPDKRLQSHRKLGWEVIELRGPMDGHLTQQLETAILRMLKARGADLSNGKIAGKFDGYSEAWSKSTFEVKSIKELMRLTEEFEKND